MDMQYVKETLEEELRLLMGKIEVCYADNRGREHAKKYITGLLSPVERKNGWQLAEARGDKTPYAIQQFLFRGRWSADELRDRLGGYVRERLGDEDATLIVDETGFLKKGKKSAGVMRQYSGTAGRVENCQVGVFLNYYTAKGFALMDRELYLPQEWMKEKDDEAAERRLGAGIPKGTEFKTKPQMALEMLKRAHEAGTPFSWVTADSLYGDFGGISEWLESIAKGYALAVSGKAYVWQGERQRKVGEMLESLPEKGWRRISAGKGTKGERYYDWYTCELNRPPLEGWKKLLLVRRSVSDPGDMRAFICFCPEGAAVKKLVRVAGSRWTVEQSFEETKGEVGLDHYEMRSYEGWYKHITLACCAHALLAVIKNRVNGDEDFQKAITPETGDSMREFKKKRKL